MNNITEEDIKKAQAEAKVIIESFYNLNNDEVYEWATDIPYPVAKMCAIISIDKAIQLTAQPSSYLELIRTEITNCK